jgi:amidase
MAPGMSRRRFLGLAAGSAALATTGITHFDLLAGAQQPAGTIPHDWLFESIPELQSRMAAGRLTSAALTQGYLDRIAHLNGVLHAVLEVNPDAPSIARHLDRERRNGNPRGPLHGIPVLLKDNIATADSMQTTAGSLALVGSRVPADAAIVQRLRAAGAVILGKTNLSEWANFRGFAPFNGWSARGGFTRDPYLLQTDPCGSSSGSAVAVAAGLCAAAVGTETDGSVVCPSGNNGIVGLKPGSSVLAQDGIIPIAHSQDTAGPMGRHVVDVAIMLDVMQGGSGASADARGGLDGARIGVDRRYFDHRFGGEARIVAVVEQGLDLMRGLGATVVDTDTGNPNAYSDDELTVLLFEFKVQIAEYLAALDNTHMRTLADLINFDDHHCGAEMRFFGQEIFDMAEATSGDLSDPVYTRARAKCLRLARDEGIDAALDRDHLDAIVAPSYSFASSPPAVAGYPDLAIPIGLTSFGVPAGVWMYGTAGTEARLLRFATDIEAARGAFPKPHLNGFVPPDPPDAGICGHGSSVSNASDRARALSARHSW